MKNGKLTVAIVGMGFGSCFLPIYLKHPDVEHVIMVDTNPDQLKALADMYLLDESYYTTDFEAVLQNPDVDAVHLVIPPALHAPMSVQVLNAGKHCACTIPMGMSMKELEDVIKARKASGKHYMFMETSVYTREYLYVEGAVRIRRNGQAAVYALRPLSGYGGLALLLGRLPAPGTSHPCHRPLFCSGRAASGQRLRQRLRQGPSGTGKAVRLPLRL
ncbi:MAG: Gfo/Idh/MocA family protein [Blautia sp.]